MNNDVTPEASLRAQGAGPFRHLLPHIDNPVNEGRWGDAKGIADRKGWPRRGMTQTLIAIERVGLVESKSTGRAPSPCSDAPPKHWRLTEAGLAALEGGGDRG
jgi:hypothetical protein